MAPSEAPDETELTAEIRARADAATAGPWYQGRDSRLYENSHEAFTRENMYAKDSYDVYPIAAKAEDAEFVAHAREDVPWLLDRIEALSARDAKLTDDFDKVLLEAQRQIHELEGKIIDLEARIEVGTQ